MEKLYDAWAKRTPYWDKKFQDTIIDKFCNYRTGSDGSTEQRGKIYGAGYEIFIIAFFLGLYANKEKRLTSDPLQRHDFSLELSSWGNVGRRGKSSSRVDYGILREYMFVALIAKTDIDFIALDKGELKLRKAVDMLMEKMQNYANYGFQLLLDKETDGSGYFFKEDAFFKLFETKRELDEGFCPDSISAPSLD